MPTGRNTVLLLNASHASYTNIQYEHTANIETCGLVEYKKPMLRARKYIT